MTLKVIDNEIIDTKINIIKQAECPSLSGRSTLTYSIGKSKEADTLIRIDKNSGTGKFNQQWVSLTSIGEIISKANSPFSWSALSPAFPNQSINTAGFVMAALVQEEFIEKVENGYQRTSKEFTAIAKKPRSSRKTAKKGAES